MKRIFEEGAWLYTMDEELTEKEFIKKAGINKVLKMTHFSFISLVLDTKKPFLIAHNNGEL
ncbi:hypothetical protein LCGC14_2016930, partial [marine sediment metagenome]